MLHLRRLAVALPAATVLLASSLVASAQDPEPPPGPPPPGEPAPAPSPPPQVAPAPPPAAPPPNYQQPPPNYQQPPPNYQRPPPGYGPPPPGYGQQPGYGQPGWSPGYGAPYGQSRNAYGFDPPEGPPPPMVQKEPSCCRWSLRFDPFDLVMRRMSFQAEVAVWGPIALEVNPTWIWGGEPYGGADKKGFAVSADAVFYLSGHAFHGWWLKAHGEYENFSATYANSTQPTAGDPTLVSPAKRLSSGVFGALIGSTLVFGNNGGFTLSGGIGVGVATAGETTLTAPGSADGRISAESVQLYTGLDRVRLLGSLALGVAF